APVGEALAIGHVKNADLPPGISVMAGAGIGDIEQLLVGREGQPIRLEKIFDDPVYLAGLAIDPIDPTTALLLWRLVALIVAHDAVAGIGEPDGAVACDHNIIGRIEPLAVKTVGNDGDRAGPFGARDTARAVFAGD